MPKKNPIPTYLHHKASGQGYCRWNGQCVYFGKHGTPESEEAFRRFCAELLTGAPPKPIHVPTVAELCDRYLEHAEAKYEGRHIEKLKSVIGIAIDLYGQIQAAEFGPAKLRAVQAYLVSQKLCPATVNQRVTMLRKVFRWAVGWELIPGYVAHALREVDGLKTPPPIARPAPDEDVRTSLAHMPVSVAAMVQIQQLTGMRPGEICRLSPAEVHRDKPTKGMWLYVPANHKNAHHGHIREILIGPAAQAILAPWLEAREPHEFVFQPADSFPWKPKRRRARKIGDRYTPEAYAKAVLRACRAAKVTPWTPNQLRHAAATRLTSEFGRETAKTVLGHRSAAMMERYARPDLLKAADAVSQIG